MRDHDLAETRVAFKASQVEGNIGEAVNSSQYLDATQISFGAYQSDGKTLGSTTPQDIKILAQHTSDLQKRVVSLANLVDMIYQIQAGTMSKEEACKRFMAR